MSDLYYDYNTISLLDSYVPTVTTDSITVRPTITNTSTPTEQNNALQNLMDIWDRTKYETKYAIEYIKPILIKTIGRKTFVTWNDGTTTKVVCEQSVNPDPFMAFCAAFTKKMMGNTSAILKTIEEADEKEQRKRKKEANRKANEERRKKEKEQFDKDVAKERYRLAVQKAAEKKLNINE